MAPCEATLQLSDDPGDTYQCDLEAGHFGEHEVVIRWTDDD